MKYKCGHEIKNQYLGRGKEREQRIAYKQKQECPTCTLETTRKSIRKVTAKLIDGTPISLGMLSYRYVRGMQSAIYRYNNEK